MVSESANRSESSGNRLAGEFNIYYQNVRGLNSKTHEFLNFSYSCVDVFDIIACTESWLSQGVADAELLCPDYMMYRDDRDFNRTGLSRGGGVFLAVRSNIPVQAIDIRSVCPLFDDIPLVDIAGVKISNKLFPVNVFVVYVPPNLPSEGFSRLCDALEYLVLTYGSNSIILGDFNLPDFSSNASGRRNLAFRSMCSLTSLCQFNNVLNSNGRVLDLVLSSTPCSVKRSEFVAVIEDQHHPSLHVSCVFQQEHPGPKMAVGNSHYLSYNFKRADLCGLYSALFQVSWEPVYNQYDCVSSLDAFYDILYDCLDTFVPKSAPGGTQRFPPWFSPSIKRDLKRKMQLWRAYTATNDLAVYREFSELRKVSKYNIRSSYTQFLSKIEKDIVDSPGRFWSFMSQRRGLNGIPSSVVLGDSCASCPREAIDLFADYFSSCFRPANISISHPPVFGGMDACTVSLPKFSISDVFLAVKKIKPNFSSGPDGIPGFLVRDCIGILAEPLLFIFNKITSETLFPPRWKISKDIPVYKSGPRDDVTNYRSISIVSNFSKLWESCLHRYLSFHMKSVISPEQHGFFSGRSTVTNLAEFVQFTSGVLEDGAQVDVIFTDFSKAFDRLDHYILLTKLEHAGFSPGLVCLLKTYLFERVHFVEWKGYRSRNYLAYSGVPQGSIIGPLLFLIFINDIVESIEARCLLYADDLKLFARISNYHDCLVLQQALAALSRWCADNCLYLNFGKCHVMSFHRTLLTTDYQYSIDGNVLNRTVEFKDLGVLLDPSLSFRNHIELLCSKCNQILGFILRTGKNLFSHDTLLLLFQTLVRSRLEYACIIWSPGYVVYQDLVENVQRKFLKYLSFLSDGVYPVAGYPHDDLLARFGMQSLLVRRQYTMVLFLFKLLNGMIDSPALLSYVTFNIPRLRSRQPRLLTLPRHHTRAFESAPVYSCIIAYSSVQSHIDIFNCGEVFIREYFSNM